MVFIQGLATPSGCGRFLRCLLFQGGIDVMKILGCELLLMSRKWELFLNFCGLASIPVKVSSNLNMLKVGLKLRKCIVKLVVE